MSEPPVAPTRDAPPWLDVVVASTPAPTKAARSDTGRQSEIDSIFLPDPDVDSLPSEQEHTPARWRELFCLMLIVAVCDATIYRGNGFAGYALLFGVVPVLIVCGTTQRRKHVSLWIVAPMLVLLAGRLLWCGSWLTVCVGVAVLMGFTMSLSGQRPDVLEGMVFAAHTMISGYRGFAVYPKLFSRSGPRSKRTHWLTIGLPLAALLVFSLLFILANPDVATVFRAGWMRVASTIEEWFAIISLPPTEVLFWMVTAWVAVGFLRPVINRDTFEDVPVPDAPLQSKSPTHAPDPVNLASRNTLIVVSLLFAVYLAFEFQTLWFRVFPKGFYYSGYAHEGAAWLTVALGVSTVILSIIFRGPLLDDPRLSRLRRLAWVWSLENMLLAVAVYHRLFIYVGFNGMTRMRIVGFYGMSAVVVGFLLVLWKIGRNRDFVWLLRRHLWTLALAIYLYSITPVDALAMRYNVGRIMAGDSAPCVQISVHAISSEGFLVLQPLVTCNDPVIREGLKALLANRLDEAESQASQRQKDGWTATQIADQKLVQQLHTARRFSASVGDEGRQRKAALEAFHKYAYQWF